MSENKFKAYLLSLQWSDNLRDFMIDARTDAHLPDAKSWEELKAYLEGNEAAESTIEAAKIVWELYVADTRG